MQRRPGQGWSPAREIARVSGTLYWFTNSAASSARIYWENKSATFAGPKLTLPVAVTVFPKEHLVSVPDGADVERRQRGRTAWENSVGEQRGRTR